MAKKKPNKPNKSWDEYPPFEPDPVDELILRDELEMESRLKGNEDAELDMKWFQLENDTWVTGEAIDEMTDDHVKSCMFWCQKRKHKFGGREKELYEKFEQRFRDELKERGKNITVYDMPECIDEKFNELANRYQSLLNVELTTQRSLINVQRRVNAIDQKLNLILNRLG